jgi:hypothetical protein
VDGILHERSADLSEVDPGNPDRIAERNPGARMKATYSPRPSDVNADQFIGRIRAAAFLDVNPQTLDKLIRTGQLRAFRIRRRVVVLRAELLRLVEANEI